jgi:hypothetical protein
VPRGLGDNVRPFRRPPRRRGGGGLPVSPLVRNLLVLAVIAAVLTAIGQASQQALTVLQLLLSLLLLAAMAYFGYTIWRENRGTFSLMSTRLRLLLYGSVLALAVVVATSSLWVDSTLKFLLCLVLIGGLGYVIYRVWQESRRYYY